MLLSYGVHDVYFFFVWKPKSFCKFFIELFYSRSNELLLWLIQKDKLDQVISTDYIVKYLTLSV